MPPLTPLTARRLFESAVAEFSPFVDNAAIAQIEDLIPLNPRKIKALVRNLATLKSEVSRHDPAELNWVDILIAQMMKIESAQFFDQLLAGSSIEDEIGINYRVKQYFSAKKGQDAAKEEATEPLQQVPNRIRRERPQNTRKTTEASRGSASAGERLLPISS